MVLISFLMLLLGAHVTAETVTIVADRDATMIEHPDGTLANGSGSFFFVGHTAQAQNGIRRTLLHFDVASVLPEHAIIKEVSLTLYMSPSNPETRELHLHRVLFDWSEGPSSSSGGGGAASEPGDTTWLHTFYDLQFWVHSGGDFVKRESARREVGSYGYYTWESTNHLEQDVRLWKAAPHLNFGWILIGDEMTLQTAKSFASREHPDPTVHPILEVTYQLPADR